MAALCVFYLIDLIDNLLTLSYSSDELSWTFFLFNLLALVAILIGIFKEYRWGEIFTVFTITEICFYYIYSIAYGFGEPTDSSALPFVNYGLAVIIAILSLTVYVLIFIIRFNRSRQMTEDFVKYK